MNRFKNGHDIDNILLGCLDNQPQGAREILNKLRVRGYDWQRMRHIHNGRRTEMGRIRSLSHYLHRMSMNRGIRIEKTHRCLLFSSKTSDK